MNPSLEERLESLPDTPGVYLHRDSQGRVLYVGKAKHLRNRVRSYFQHGAAHDVRIQTMVKQVRDVSVFETGTEAEALILENNLIKKHQPRYNVNLKDDKSYPFFKLTVNEMYPRLFLVREKLERDAEYFGPYASVKDARETLSTIRRHFKLRTSKMKLDGTRTYKPCLNFQLRKCLAPCRGTVAVEDYRANVNKVRLFLLGRDRELIARMTAELNAAAEAQRFEEAAQLRDAIRAVQRTLEKQQVMTPDPQADQDVFGLYRESHFAGVQVLFIRNGRLMGTDFFMLDRTEGMADGELLKGVLAQLYTRPSALLPREVLIPAPVDDQALLEGLMSEQRGTRVQLLVPQRGDKRRMMGMAEANAKRLLGERMQQHVDDGAVLGEVQQQLGLRRLPERVEAFDISNMQGSHTVASMVVWERNRAAKQDYRKFRIRAADGPDDFRSMHEVLTRRYRRVLTGEQPLPDLILIDGGKGQVNIAAHVLGSLGIGPQDVDLIGLAKGRSERRRGVARGGEEDYEYVVKPSQKNELRLRKNSATLHFLQRIRDESHRFAITFHRSLRKRETLRSDLEALPGIGRKRAQALLRHFGSMKAVRGASLAELQAAPGVSAGLAQRIHDGLRGDQPQSA